jgi:hypothetical protein
MEDLLYGFDDPGANSPLPFRHPLSILGFNWSFIVTLDISFVAEVVK